VCLRDLSSELSDGTTNLNLRFASAESLETVLGVAPGSVTPLGAANDPCQGGGDPCRPLVTVVMDERVAVADRVHCHPLRNTATLTLEGRGLVAFLEHTGHPPVLRSFPDQE